MSARCYAEDISQERIEVDDIAWLWRESQDDDHQLVRREDEDVLPVVAVTIVHVLRHVGKLAVSVQPEEGAIVVAAAGSRLACIVHPSFGQDSLVANTSVIEVHLSEACEIHCRGVEVRRAQRSAAHILLEDGTEDAEWSKEPRVHIAEEHLIR